MSKPPPTKRPKKGGDDILFIPADIPAETNVEWREKFNEKINEELKSIKEKGATSVLLEDEFRAIVNYLLEVQKSGSNDNGTVHGGDTNPSNGTTNEESTSAEKELSAAEKAKRNRWNRNYQLDGSDLKYLGRDDGLTVTHSGRLFSDLQEIYCLENKHVHQKEKDEKMETAKSKFGRSITLTLINIFHKSCPICVEYKKKKKEMVAVKKENEVNEVNRLKEELMEKKKEVEKQVSEVERLKQKLVETEEEVEALKAQHNEPLIPDSASVGDVFFDNHSLNSSEKEEEDYPTYKVQLPGDTPPLLESGKPLLLYSKILEPSEPSGPRKPVMKHTPISHFRASLRSVLYTVGISEIIEMINHRYDFSNLMKNETVIETQESDYVLRALQKLVAKVVENQPSKTTLDVISYYSNVSEQNTELLDVIEELAPGFDDDTWRKAIEQYREDTVDEPGDENQDLLYELDDALDNANNANFEKLRIYFRSKSPALKHVPNLVNVISKHCIEFLQEYIERHNELVTVLESMESGEDIEITKNLCNAACKSVLKCAKKGDVTMDVSVCFELLLKWLSLENLFFVTANNTRYSHLKVSTNNKSDTYNMATLLNTFSIDDHGAYLVIFREGKNDTRIDDVLSLCLQQQKKICIVLRSFIRYEKKNNQYDVYVTSKHERSKWTLLDDANVYVDAKEALALSSYANCFFYEILSEADYNGLANSEESLIKKLETLRNEAKLVASVVSVGLHCSENDDVENQMFKLVENFFLRPNCYPQLFTRNDELSATGNLYLKEALCIKQYSVKDKCILVMQEYLKENVPLELFSRLHDKKSVVRAFKQHILNKITTDLRIYQAPIKCDQLYEQLAEWTIARGTSST